MKNDTLKALAVLLMVVDHLGVVFWPEVPALRWVGRLCLPLFAFHVAQGWRFSRDRSAYALRLLVFAWVAQVPFSLAFDTLRLNILFSFLLGLAALWCVDRQEWLLLVLVLVVGGGPGFSSVDYGFFAPALIVVFYVFRSASWRYVGCSVLLVPFALVGIPMQVLSLLGVLLVDLWRYLPAVRLPRPFFYWFYPGHLAVFVLVRSLA